MIVPVIYNFKHCDKEARTEKRIPQQTFHVCMKHIAEPILFRKKKSVSLQLKLSKLISKDTLLIGVRRRFKENEQVFMFRRSALPAATTRRFDLVLPASVFSVTRDSPFLANASNYNRAHTLPARVHAVKLAA